MPKSFVFKKVTKMRKNRFSNWKKKSKYLGKRIENKLFIPFPPHCLCPQRWMGSCYTWLQPIKWLWQQTLHSPLWYQEISCNQFCLLVAYSPFFTVILQHLHELHPVTLFLGLFHTLWNLFKLSSSLRDDTITPPKGSPWPRHLKEDIRCW